MDNQFITQKLDEDLKNNVYPPAMLARIVFLNYFRQLFYGREPGKLKYDPDETLTEVRIEDSWTLNDAVIQKSPTIVFNRTPMVPMNAALSNNLLNYDVSGDTHNHIDLLTTTVMIYCVSPSLYESEFMASFVFNTIRYFKEDIRSKGIHQILNPILGSPEVARYAGAETILEAVNTPVNCQIFLVDRWFKRWKTDTELANYEKRTGIDPRGYNIPPNTLGDLTIITEKK